MPKFFISPPFGNYLNLENTISIKGSFTLYPREGLLTRILLTLRYNFTKEGWVNKIGLRNKGIDYAIKKYKDQDCILSVAILNHKEIETLVKKIPENTNLELNVSCPNVTLKDIEEKKYINNNLSLFLNKKRDWCIIKVSPLAEINLIDNYYNQGFRQFHFSNTYPLEDGSGGLSGKTLYKYNKKNIPKIKEKYPDVIIIGGGGITEKKDILNYFLIGADHFSFSTVFFNPYKAYNLYKDLKKFNF